MKKIIPREDAGCRAEMFERDGVTTEFRTCRRTVS
jgi:hypothetical protein